MFTILLDRLREDKHASSRIASGFQILQRAIGIGEGERQGVGFDGNRSRLAQEIEAVLLRIGRDASNDLLSKNLAIVVERGNWRHVNTSEGKRAASLQCTQGRRDQFPGRRKDDRAVEFVRRLVGCPAHP